MNNTNKVFYLKTLFILSLGAKGLRFYYAPCGPNTAQPCPYIAGILRFSNGQMTSEEIKCDHGYELGPRIQKHAVTQQILWQYLSRWVSEK